MKCPLNTVAVEECLESIKTAQPAELRDIEAMIDVLTSDLDEQAAVMAAILDRFGILNLEATPNFTPRFCNN